MTLGYSEKTARAQGSQNLTKLNIQEAIQKAQFKDSKKLEITRESQLADLDLVKKKALERLDDDIPQFKAFMKAIELQNKMLGLKRARQNRYECHNASNNDSYFCRLQKR